METFDENVEQFNKAKSEYFNSTPYKDKTLKETHNFAGSAEGLSNLKSHEIEYLNKLENRTNGLKQGLGVTSIAEHSNGFGLGFKGSMSASRGEHFQRFLKFTNPVSGSSREILFNAVGVLNKNQSIKAKKATSFFGKLGSSVNTLAVLGTTAYTLGSGGDLTDVAETMLPFAGAQMGWRAGKALGGAVTKANTIGRFVGMTVGGATGGYLAMEAVSGLISGAKDMTSNQSGIAAFALKMSGKEMNYSSMDSKSSLTNRQKALQKLSRSGLNDRGQLLGNEALVLAGMY